MRTLLNTVLEIGTSLGVLLASFWLLYDPLAIESRRCEQDECGWMAASHQTWQDLVIERRFDREIFSQGIQRTRYGWMNPTLPKLVFGLVLHLDGYDLPPPDVFPILNPSLGRINRSPDWYADRTVEHHPFLVRLRQVNTWIMALSAVALYSLVLQIAGRTLALLTALLFAATPLVGFVAVQVGTDALVLLLSIASMDVAAKQFRIIAASDGAPRIRSTLISFALIGALLGLTLSAKFNGAAACLVIATAVVVLWATGKFARFPRWLPGLWLLVAATVGWAIFHTLNPWLWDGPIQRPLEWLREWGDLVRNQQTDYPQIAVLGPSAKLRAVTSRIALAWAPWGAWTPALFSTLIVAGLFLSIRRFIVALRRGSDAAAPCFALAWIVVVFAATAFWLPLDFPRYYLPLVPPACALAMMPVASLIDRGRSALWDAMVRDVPDATSQ